MFDWSDECIEHHERGIKHSNDQFNSLVETNNFNCLPAVRPTYFGIDNCFLLDNVFDLLKLRNCPELVLSKINVLEVIHSQLAHQPTK